MISISKLELVPSKSGVYLWKDKWNNIIYIGKAKSLKNRMKQYFQKVHNSRIMKLRDGIADFSYIITDDEREALILERNLILKHKPKYNILLQDDKVYPYIRLKIKNNNLDIKISNRIKKDGAFYYGPFPNGYGARNIYKLIVRLTKYRNGLIYKADNDEYNQNSLKLAKKILSPNNNFIKKELKDKMENAAKNMQYEIAQEIKEILESLDFYVSKSSTSTMDNDNFDVIGVVNKDKYLSISVISYRFGNLLSKRDIIVDNHLDVKSTIEQFLSQYYNVNFVPDYILLNNKYKINNSIFDFKIIYPIKGNKKIILNIAEENAKDNVEKKFQKYELQKQNIISAINELEKITHIQNLKRIIMFDNSNMNNLNPISVVVVYENGYKKTSDYKKFNLEVRDRSSDVDYLNQALNRYFAKTKVLPNLLIVDGGIQQVNEAKKILAKFNMDIPLIGLVKNDKHKTDHILLSNGKKIFLNNGPLFNFLSNIQYEVDRFAKLHYRRRKVSSSLSGKLENIKGVGIQTINKLLKKFETFNGIYNASLIELESIVSKNIAQKIKEAI